MAHQYNTGTVKVTNAEVTVYHEWMLLLVSVTGPGFAQGANITWTGGAGFVSSWDAISKTLKLYRTSGVVPAIGLTVTSGTNTGVINSFGAGTPANWNTRITLPAVATFDQHHLSYDVATLAIDSFTLAAPGYQGLSAYDLEYGLNSDFTSLGLGLIRPGDVGATAIMSRNMTRLSNLLTRGGVHVRLGADAVLTSGGAVTLNWEVEVEDSGGFITVPNTVLTVPANVSRIDVCCAILLTAAISNANQVIELQVRRNTAVLLRQSFTRPQIAGTVGINGLKVTAGDTISIVVGTTNPDVAALPSVDMSPSTNLFARVAEVI